jgi:WD40 repeat protein
MKIPPDTADLLEAYLEGRLSPDETAGLEARLRVEPDLARTLLLLSRQEVFLHYWAHATQTLDQAEDAIACASEGVPLVFPEPARPRRAGSGRAASLLGVLSMAAALALVCFLPVQPGKQADRLARGRFGPVGPDASRKTAVARLSVLNGNVYVRGKSGRTAARRGQEVLSGQEVETVGDGSFAVVCYPDGTRLELSGDTMIRLQNTPSGDSSGHPARRVFLAGGGMATHVGEQALESPMLLETPHAEVQFLGTSFLSSSGPEATRVDPEEGNVRMTRRSDGKTIEVPQGSYAVAHRGGGLFAPHRQARQTTHARAVLKEGSGPVMAVGWSPDGKTVATGGWTGRLTLWNAADGKVRSSLRAYSGKVVALAFSPDGTSLATAGITQRSRPGAVKLWEVAGGLRERLSLPNLRNVHALAYSPDGRTLAVEGYAGKGLSQIALWDVETGKLLGDLPGTGTGVRCLAFSPDGSNLAGSSLDGTVRLWDVITRSVRLTLPRQARPVQAVVFSPDGQTLATGSRDGIVKLWSLDGALRERLLMGPFGEVRALAFSPDGRTLAVANNSLARLWDVASGQEWLTCRGHRYAVHGLAFSPDGLTLATAGSDGLVKLWNAKRRQSSPGRF